jgi:hypothetical protein
VWSNEAFRHWISIHTDLPPTLLAKLHLLSPLEVLREEVGADFTLIEQDFLARLRVRMRLIAVIQ